MKLPKISTLQLFALWLLCSIFYMAWLGPMMISAEFTPIVLLGVALGVLLFWWLVKIINITLNSISKETK